MLWFFRMESISIKQWHGLAKVLGSIVSLGGAMVYILIKGPPVYSISHKKISTPSTDSHSKGDWLKGSLAAISSNIVWSLWIIMQVLSLPLIFFHFYTKVCDSKPRSRCLVDGDSTICNKYMW